MLIYSTTGPLYPITITDLHVSENDEIERSGKLFTYFYKIVVTESTRYGTEKDVVKKVYVTFSSEIVGTLKEWKIERGTVIRGPGYISSPRLCFLKSYTNPFSAYQSRTLRSHASMKSNLVESARNAERI